MKYRIKILFSNKIDKIGNGDFFAFSLIVETVIFDDSSSFQ